MTEAGGASTQAGIYYQNSVAALYLAELLELSPAPARERVVSVRVEAPTDIDDIVIDYADGHRHYLSAKLTLHVSDDAWISLWKSLKSQVTLLTDRWDDCITLVIAEASSTVRNLKELCDRAATSTDAAELAARLTTRQTALLARISDGTEDADTLFEFVRRTRVRVLTEAEIVEELARRRVDGGGAAPATMLSILRDLAGANARVRATFRAPNLRRRLAEEYQIQVCEPSEWGISAYRETMERGARIEVPGTGLSGPAQEMFVWPRVRDWERTSGSYFEDELPARYSPQERSVIDLKTFPSDNLHRCVVVAGPGHGKSALLSALTGRMIAGSVLPVLVPLASLAASNASITEFLTEHVNRAYDVRIDWRRLAEQGLVAVFLDGLDEVSSSDRVPLLSKLSTFSARYPHVPWLLTVRDPAVLTSAIDARTLEILPLSDVEIDQFAKAMRVRCPRLGSWSVVDRLGSYPDLQRLARIPLFLAMMLATIDGSEDLPASRADLIERYLRTLFAPHEHKVAPGKPLSVQLLRAVAAKLAFERLERGEIGASEREVRTAASAFASSPDEIERLQIALVDQGRAPPSEHYSIPVSISDRAGVSRRDLPRGACCTIAALQD